MSPSLDEKLQSLHVPKASETLAERICADAQHTTQKHQKKPWISIALAASLLLLTLSVTLYNSSPLPVEQTEYAYIDTFPSETELDDAMWQEIALSL